MEVLVGSLNPSKLKAIQDACKRCVYFQDEKITIQGIESDSGVSHMPLSLEETLEGAKNRAKKLYNGYKKGDFYIGIEGGTTLIGEKAFLVGVICIIDRYGKTHIGLSPLLEIPSKWKEELYEKNADLGELTDRITSEKDTGKKNGAIGALTDNMITRSDMFEQAFFCAIAPFYNQYYK